MTVRRTCGSQILSTHSLKVFDKHLQTKWIYELQDYPTPKLIDQIYQCVVFNLFVLARYAKTFCIPCQIIIFDFFVFFGRRRKSNSMSDYKGISYSVNFPGEINYFQNREYGYIWAASTG